MCCQLQKSVVNCRESQNIYGFITMPLFGRKDKHREKNGTAEPASPIMDAEISKDKDEKVKQIQEEHRAHQIAKQLSFNAQLAHGSPTVKIGNFTNVKELYQRIADGLNVPVTEVNIVFISTFFLRSTS